MEFLFLNVSLSFFELAMDPLFHFIFSVVVAFALGLHRKHKAFFVIGVAVAASLIDLDHLISIFYNPVNSIYFAPFHNLFFVILFPLILFLISFYKEKGTSSIKWQSFSLILFVLLFGHLLADSFDHPVFLLFPFSSESFFFPNTALVFSHIYPLITSFGLMSLIYFIVISLVLFVEDFIYFFEKKHERFSNAVKDVFKDLS